MMDFKQLLAWTDGKNIYNCEPGTLVHYHEERHIQQMNAPLTKHLWNWLPVFAWLIGIISLGLMVIYKEFWMLLFAGMGIAPFSLFMLVMEIDAWIYAFKNRYWKINTRP